MRRVGLLKIAGVCAVVYAVGLVAFFAVMGPTGALSAPKTTDFLRIVMEHRTRAIAGLWLFVLLPPPLAVAGLGCVAAFRSAGRITWVAALAFVGGSLLALLRNILWLAVAEKLAPAYVGASAGDRVALAGLAETLNAFGFVMGSLLGGVSIGAIGVPLFSAAMLRSGRGPRWVAWLGFAVGIVAGGGMLLAHLDKAFGSVAVVAMPLVVIWMISLGVVLWRTPEPAIP